LSRKDPVGIPYTGTSDEASGVADAFECKIPCESTWGIWSSGILLTTCLPSTFSRRIITLGTKLFWSLNAHSNLYKIVDNCVIKSAGGV
jgi:hypothetical protein